MESHRHGLFCRLRSGVRRLARRSEYRPPTPPRPFITHTDDTNIDDVSGSARGRPLPTRGAHRGPTGIFRAFRQVNAQAGPSSRPAQSAATHNGYLTPPPTYSSPAPAPGPALPATAPTQLSPAVILDRISQQLADNHDELVGRLDDNFRLINGHLGEMNETMAQIRDTSFDTLSESFHSADEEALALSDAGTASAPTADSEAPAGNAVPTQAESPVDSETDSSMYASTELETPRDSAPPGPPPMIAGADSDLPPAAAGHVRLPLDTQSSVDLGEAVRDTSEERTLRRRRAFRSLSLPMDEASNAAASTSQDASTSLNANRIFSRSASLVDADVDQETGRQGTTASLEAPPPASNAAPIGDHESQDVDAQAELEEDPVLTLLCPGTLQLIIDVGTDGSIGNGDILLFFGDFDVAIQRLPGICAEREIEWSHLFLHSMMTIMGCLKPYLRCFTGVHLVMNARLELNGSDQNTFRDDFARLLSLRVEGNVTKNRLLLFPLYSLRQLTIKAKIDLLDVLQLDCRGGPRTTRVTHAAVAPLLQDAAFPPAIYLKVDDPTVYWSTTMDLRLTANSSLCTDEIRQLFARHHTWALNA
ncbi:hypothetical protein K525DRAFT_285188 [Schizophyllum commune Loenen D]|nr:hypothetical protein K525DRAFT_285188 [Schizophyllum commune Loenen D]